MITSIELASAVYKLLNKSPNIKNLLGGGGIYLLNRPFNSGKNDIVVGVLPVSGDQLQFSTVVINFYASDLFANGTYVPNTPLLLSVTKAIIPLVDDVLLEDIKTNLEIEYQTDYAVDGDVKEWVSAIRLRGRTING